jgi:hypothetical protein
MLAARAHCRLRCAHQVFYDLRCGKAEPDTPPAAGAQQQEQWVEVVLKAGVLLGGPRAVKDCRDKVRCALIELLLLLRLLCVCGLLHCARVTCARGVRLGRVLCPLAAPTRSQAGRHSAGDGR